MKKALKIAGGIFGGLVSILLIFSIVTGYIAYPFSLMKKSFDCEYEIEDNIKELTEALYNDSRYKTGWFNYYGLKYSTDHYFKGTITYFNGIKKLSEDFFLEPAENGTFYSFIDGFLDGKKANALCHGDARFF